MQEFLSVKQAAALLGVSERRVHQYCKAGRIAGARKFGSCWAIPAGAKKPADPRRAKKAQTAGTSANADTGAAPPVFFVAVPFFKKESPAAALARIEPALRPLAAADTAYRQGNSAAAEQIWRQTPASSPAKLTAASLAVAAAISLGDYPLYREVDSYLSALLANAKTNAEKAVFSLPGAMAAVSMGLPELTPGWLKSCDFSLFDPALTPFLLYLYILHLRNLRRYDAMLAAASATLLLCRRADSFTWLDLYLGVLCAVAAFALHQTALAERYLFDALRLAAPCGMITPFADHLGALGGTVEIVFAKNVPQLLEPTLALWNRSFKNWMQFRSRFAKEKIATVLNAQEYHAARLIAGGCTYAEAAGQMYLSVSRIKKILTEVYGKLGINTKRELAAYLL